MEENALTPWTVRGSVDYTALIKKFGTEPLDQKIIGRWEKITGKKIHHLIRRGLVFSHQDIDKILDALIQGIPMYLYTGRGPSTGSMHLGHLIPFKLTKYLQDALNCMVVIQMSDDEKFFFKNTDDLEMFQKFSYQNARDIIACGFDPNRTLIFSNSQSNTGDLYKNNMVLMKSMNMNLIKSVYGIGETLPGSVIQLLKDELKKDHSDPMINNDINSTLKKFSSNQSNNLGQCMWPAFQSSPGFCTSFRQLFARAIDNTLRTRHSTMSKNALANTKMCLGQLLKHDSEQSMLCLIPMAIDQAPYLRTCRDFAHILKCPKPCGIFTEFLPGLQGVGGKMSSTSSGGDSMNSTIFLSMDPRTVEKMIKRHAFSGGKETLSEHQKYGGDIEVDVCYQYLTFFLESDDELARIAKQYTNGTMGSGQIKDLTAGLISDLIKDHQKALGQVDDSVLDQFFSWDRTLDSGGLDLTDGQNNQNNQAMDDQMIDGQVANGQVTNGQGINFDRTFGYKCKSKECKENKENQ
jgi:tryptophanyl-tRNA synthetase